MKTMTIGRLAGLGEVNIDTIRYYEREQLLLPPTRTASGYRQYGQTDLKRLQFIRRAKALGFSLQEIRDLLSLTSARISDMHGVKRKAEVRLKAVEHKISELQRVKRGLKKLIAACPGHGELSHCPIIAALSGTDPQSGAAQ